MAGVIVGKAVILRQVTDATEHGWRSRAFSQQISFSQGFASDAEQDFDQRGLAGAVLTQEAENFLLLDLERDSLESLDLAISFGQILGLDDGHGTPQHRQKVRFPSSLAKGWGGVY